MYAVFIIGADGNVGREVAAACKAEGWLVHAVDSLPENLRSFPNALVIDCGKPGHLGWGEVTWPNYFLAVQRATLLIDQCNQAPNVKGMLLCSTPWVAVKSTCAYSEAKYLIEQIAHSHNRFGSYPVVVDRVGMQVPDPVGSRSRFEESVRQASGELGERAVASLLCAISFHEHPA